jgi:hypothetical protein
MQCDRCGRELGAPGVRLESDSATVCDQCATDVKPESPPDAEPREASILAWGFLGLLSSVVGWALAVGFLLRSSSFNVFGALLVFIGWSAAGIVLATMASGGRAGLGMMAGLGVFLFIFFACLGVGFG